MYMYILYKLNIYVYIFIYIYIHTKLNIKKTSNSIQNIGYTCKHRVLKPQMAKKNFLKMFNILSQEIKKMQIKTTWRFHLSPVRMTKINKANDSICQQRSRDMRTLTHCWWEYKLTQPLQKTNAEGSQKSKNRSTTKSSHITPE